MLPVVLAVAFVACSGGTGTPVGTSLYGPQPPGDPPSTDRSPPAVLQALPPRDPPAEHGPLGELDIERYVIDVTLDTTGARVSGTTTLRARITRPGRSFALDYAASAAIASVTGDVTRFTRDRDVLYLVSPTELPLGPFAATITHSASMNPGPVQCAPEFGGLMRVQNLHGDMVVNSYNWPERTRRWIPSIDHPRDGAAVELGVTADAALTIVANGRLVSRDDGPTAGTSTWRWEQPEEMPAYVIHISAFPYRRHELGTAPGNVRVGAFLYPEDTAFLPPLREAPAALRFFSERLAPYAWGARYDMVEAPICGGAMEDVTAVSFDERELRSARARETVVHEIVHQWFGNRVRVASWNDLWISEGVATYLTGLYLLETNGRRAFDTYMSTCWRQAHQAERRRDHPLRPPDPEVDPLGLFDSITYDKGAWLLHTLRMHVGDDTFWSAMRGLIAAHSFDAITIDQFQAAFDDAHGESLSWLFEEQFKFVGHPQLAAAVAWDAERRIATVTVDQIHTVGLPLYHVPLEVEVRDSRGGPHRVTAQLTQDLQPIEVPLPSAPTRVILDPREILYADIRCQRDADCPASRSCGRDRWCQR